MEESSIQMESVVIPTSLNSEDSVFQMAELQFSMRQILTVLAMSGLWFMFGKMLADGIGMGLGWALILFSPILFAGLFLAFVKRTMVGESRFALFDSSAVPVEEWLSDWISYRISEKRYSLIEPRDMSMFSLDELPDLEDDSDEYAGYMGADW